MTYRMIAIDIDDTLLNDDLVVTEITKEALAAARAHDVFITLATGRMYASAQAVAKQIGLNVPLVTYQGALVKNLIDESTLYERFVPAHITHYIFDYAQKHGLHVQAYYNDQLIVPEANDKVRDYVAISNIPYIVTPNLHSIAAQPMSKLLFIDEPDYLDEIAHDLKQHIGDDVHLTKSKPQFLEVLHKEATKGHAISFLAAHYGIDLSQVIAIGDSWNDMQMIEVAGLGVAMGNAIDGLKDIADYVTASNNDDGVAQVISRFILEA